MLLVDYISPFLTHPPAGTSLYQKGRYEPIKVI